MPLEKLNLPSILRAAGELVEAAISYRLEDHSELLASQTAPLGTPDLPHAIQFRWHDALDAIQDTANRLKRALGATGELQPNRVRAEKTPAAWLHFDSKFLNLDYARSVRVGLRRMAIAAIDLSGYAELRQPLEEFRQRALVQLGSGIMQVWPALSAEECGEVQPLLPTFRQAFGWPDADCAPPAWSGPVEIAQADEYRIIDLSSFSARPKAYLNDLGQIPAQQEVEICKHPQNEPDAEAPKPAQVQPRPKKSTTRGEGQIKLIAALSQHHGYDNGGVSTTEPINNNELARRAKVDPSTASDFFRKHFGGYEKYRNHYCNQVPALASVLKHLNGEYTTDALFGGKPPGEDDCDE